MAFEGSTLWRLRQKVGTDLVLWPRRQRDGRARRRPSFAGRRLDNGMWAIPGGGAEAGSSFSDTAVTELREEVGIDADEADLDAFACISRVDNHLETYPNGDVTHYFGIWFALRRWSGDPVGDGQEMGEVIWADLDDLPRPLLGSTDLRFVLCRSWLETGRFQAYWSAPSGTVSSGRSTRGEGATRKIT